MATKCPEKLCAELANMTADYRTEDLCRATPEHVQWWLDQLDETEETKIAFLAELIHVLKQTYFSKDQAKKFLKFLATNDKFTSSEPKHFWKNAAVLDIQQGGSSQTELRALLEEVLEEQLGVSLADPDEAAGPYVYLDDALFSGNRVVWDIRKWLPSSPDGFSLQIVVCALHRGGAFYCRKTLEAAFAESKKKVDLSLWRALPFENMKNSGGSCDVLRLKSLPPDKESAKYVASFGDGRPAALLRPSNEANRSSYYSSEQNRDLLERVFWKAGLKVRAMCPNLKVTHRPMGYTSTNSENRLGFGSLFVSFRNCPNNAPLALWAGDPWYPLFTRKTN